MSTRVPPFTNHLPVKIQFGDGVSARLADVLQEEGATRCFVAIDDGLEQLIPGIGRTLAAVETAGTDVVRFAKTPGEPTRETVDAASEALMSSACDAVVAIGGGSVLDTAKVARLSAAAGMTFSELLDAGITYRPPELPLICLPTTAGTGSEVSGGAVITDAATSHKTGVASPHLRAQHSLVDPVLTHALPPTVTAHTGIDALAQAIAAVVARTRTPIGDGIALEATRLAAHALPVAWRDGSNAAARTEMACASLLAGLAMNISDCAAEHSLAQALGGAFHLPHGLTVGLVLAETLERERQHVPALIERVGDALGAPRADRADGTRTVAAIHALLAELQFPTLREVGVSESDLDDLTDRALGDFFITQSPHPWTREEVYAAFRAGLELERRAGDPELAMDRG